MKKIIIVLILISLMSCSPRNDIDNTSNPVITTSSISTSYEVIYIEGMPCIVVSEYTTLNGITCDWTKWDGNK